jgi:diguanylate cyclase (GGDEF)-like protein/PAS domain S-box-containing protein
VTDSPGFVPSAAPEDGEAMIQALITWLRSISPVVLLPELELALSRIGHLVGADRAFMRGTARADGPAVDYEWTSPESGHAEAGHDAAEPTTAAPRAPRTEPTTTLETTFRLPDGSEGTIGLETTRAGRAWRDDDLVSLQVIASLVTQVLERTESDLRWEQAAQRDESIFRHAPVPLFVVDGLGFIVKANDKTAELVGLPRHEVLGEHVGRFIHPDDYDSQADLWVRMQVEPRFDSVSSEIRLLTSRGISWQRVALRAGRDDAGVLTHITVHLADISEKYAAEAALDRSQRQFGNLLDSLPDPIVRLNRRFEVEFSNPAALALRERTRQVGGANEWPRVAAEDQERVDRAMRQVLESGTSCTIEHRVDDDSTSSWCETTIVGETNADGTVKSLLLICRDISDRRRHEDELDRQAHHDGLTGLPNRGRFAQLLDVATVRQGAFHEAGRPRSLAVLFIDLDRFKVVNDSLGHAAGDDLLCQVAQRLGAALRPDDVLGRLGGDEFTILADDIEHADALLLAERLQEQLRTPFHLAGREHLMTASVGVVTAARPEDPADLMRWADTAMYRAKRLGRNCIVVFDDVLRNEASEQLELDQLLRVALDRGELTVRYQPEVDLGSGDVVGAEALVRWDHPARGLLSADEFVPLAEDNGAIVPIGRWVLATACTQVAGWQQRGLLPEHFVLRVNLSARQLELPSLVDEVRHALDSTSLEPRRLCLEITETALMRDVDRALVVLTRLHELGLRLAVDDFGTGYSSLISLKRIPLQVLKIDRSFIDGLPDDADDRAIATTVLRLADSLGLTVTAEGVETTEQADLLRELGCPTAQGYLFAPPLSPEEFEQRLITVG